MGVDTHGGHNVTVDELTACIEGGRFWFMRSNGVCYGTPNDQPQQPNDIRLGDFPESWVDQWNGDLQRAVDEMDAAGLWARLNEFRN